MPTRSSRAEWRGDLKTGNGEFTIGEDVYTGAYTFVSRFEEGDGTNPEELIGAAHAACFSMALSNMLAQAGNPAEAVRTEAVVHLEPVDGKPTIHTIELITRGTVPGIDQDTFAEHAENAKEGCPVSRLLTGATITLDAKLEG
jgi:lipoyl-dependent peroxiredoxin